MANANIKATITAEDRASSVISGVGNSFGLMAGAMAVGQVAANAVTRAFGAMAGAAKNVVTQAASFEQTRIGLENMLGSADKARKLLSDVSKFAAETPFEFPELAKSTRMLVAFGFSAKEAFNGMKTLGDVASAVGANIEDVSYLYGTLRAQGRAYTVDIKQFATRGIPIYEYLGKVLKADSSEVSKLVEAGKVGFPEVEKAFELMTGKGGQFHQAMAKQSKSLSGLWSTFKDIVNQTGRELVGITNEGDVKAGSLFDKLRNGLSTMIAELPRIAETISSTLTSLMPTLMVWGEAIVNAGRAVAEHLAPKLVALWNTLVEFVPTLVPIAETLGTGLVIAIGLAVDAINLLLTVLQPLFSWLSQNKSAVTGITSAITVYYATMKAVEAFNVFKNNISTATGLIKTLASGISTARGRYVLLKTAMSAPITLSIVIGAAMIALQKVYDEGRKLQALLDAITNAKRDLGESKGEFVASLGRARKAGRISNSEYQSRLSRYNASMAEGDAAIAGLSGRATGFADTSGGFPRRASGTDFWGGGMVEVGEQGRELVKLPRGSKVVPNNQVKNHAGRGATVVNITVPMMTGSAIERRNVARMLIKDIQDVAALNGVTPTEMLGSNFGLGT